MLANLLNNKYCNYNKQKVSCRYQKVVLLTSQKNNYIVSKLYTKKVICDIILDKR